MSGKKTWIGLILANVGVIVSEVAAAVQSGTVTPDQLYKVGTALVVIVGAGHKLYKGE